MKKQVIITVLALGAILFGINSTQAQIGPEVTTSVNIILNDVISFESGSVANGGAVDFNYDTANDYNSTKTANVPSSLIVTSTKSFEIKAKANGENFTDGTNNIPVGVVTIKPVTGGTTTMGVSFPDIG